MNVLRKTSLILCVCGIVLLLVVILSALLPMLLGAAPVGIIGGAELPTLRHLFLILGWRLLAIPLGAALLLAGLCVGFIAKKIKKK